MNTNKYNIICFGEVLWDILPSGPAAGGAPVNVAYHLKKLGQRPAIISRLGADFQGLTLQKAMEKGHISTEFVQIDPSYPTGIVHATPDKDHNMAYDIVQPVAWDFIEQENSPEKGRKIQTLIHEAEYFIFGSLAARGDISKATLFSLLEMAGKKVLDINLRAPHFNKALILTLIGKADILKLNEEELFIITGWLSDKKFTTIEDNIHLLHTTFNTSTIIVTCGAKGVILHHNGRFYSHPGIKVTVEDTVGSGDAFLAAFLAKTIAGAPPDAALAYGCAVGAMVASKPGAWAQYQLEEVENIAGYQGTKDIKAIEDRI